MSESKDRLDQLQHKLDSFLQKQQQMQKEVLLLRSEIRSLQRREQFNLKKSEDSEQPTDKKKEEAVTEKELPLPEEFDSFVLGKYQENKPEIHEEANSEKRSKASWLDFEKLLGENLINKIGIIITVIGVAIGSNYVIENDLISPLTRIILGYLFSIGLVGVAYRLKNKYLNYSAVIMGGAMASMYLITFAAYNFYGLIPQLVTFIIMALITGVTVVTAIGYNKEWISVFGLVGGYAVPFLVGGESSNYIVLFSYILFINLGVLFIALQRYWKILYYSAFLFTWLIFLSWFNLDFSYETDIVTSLLFSTLFFFIFYASSLAYKIRNKKKLSSLDISTILTNTFLFFGIGYQTLEFEYEHLHGLFTVLIALIHFLAGRAVKKFELPSPTTLNFLNGLVLVFLTLAIPIQFQDKWITMAWSLEALLLVWMGRKKGLRIFEVLSYPVIILAFLGLLGYWFDFLVFSASSDTLPFINSLFGTFLVFWAAFYAIQYLIVKNPSDLILKPGSKRLLFFKIGIPFVLVFTLYFNLLFEIQNIFSYWDLDSILIFKGDGRYSESNPVKAIWVMNYTFTFLGLGTLVNKGWFRIPQLDKISLYLYGALFLFFFASFFTEVKFLRELYLGEFDTKGLHQSAWNIVLRYILIGFAGWGLFVCKKLVSEHYKKPDQKVYFELFLAFSGIFILSTELIQWLDIAGFSNSYKLGLSILWGACSLALIFYGIVVQKKHLRIGAIFVFFVTLLKLFFYDISHLSTISKTIVFISLGILLLVISYLYNRFKDELSTELGEESS
ncbi:MAG: DUF2339 domain-containing protein [Cytophagales bacterium]|jgi:hypothetical protein